MKKKLIGLVMISGLFCGMLHAETVDDNNVFPPITWSSKGGNDTVTVQNGTGANMTVMINVIDDGTTDAAGINIKNCGKTTHVDPGSSVVCVTSDPNNPISFTSDKPSTALGTYQIKQ